MSPHFTTAVSFAVISLFAVVPSVSANDAISPHLTLSPDGALSASFGGSTRLRYEYRINPAFGATSKTSPTKNDDYLLERVYAHVDLRYSTYLRVYVEGVAAYIDGENRHPPAASAPSDDIDLYQAFIEISPLDRKRDGFGLTLRIGRQEMPGGGFDRQKLVGVGDWSNVRHSWDGVVGMVELEAYTFELFWVRPVIINPKSFDATDPQTNFAGVHLTHPLYGTEHNYSLFAYYLNRSRDTKPAFAASEAMFDPNGQKGDTDRVTLGGRVWGRFQNDLDYDVEGGAQVGRLAQDDILAGYVSSEVGYTFAGAPATPRLSFGYDFASGDERRGDGQANTFDQLFPTRHTYLGYLDLVGRQNLHAGNVTLLATPTHDLKVWATWYTFALASPHDALYNKSGQAIRYSASGTAGSYVGNELDLAGSYDLGRHVTLQLGYSIFLPGTFIRNTGQSEVPQMMYSSIEIRF